jgi:hypothetical protein
MCSIIMFYYLSKACPSGGLEMEEVSSSPSSTSATSLGDARDEGKRKKKKKTAGPRVHHLVTPAAGGAPTPVILLDVRC